MRFKFLVLVIILVLLGCRDSSKSIDFYYFRSQFQLNEIERNALEEFKTKNLIVKLFDIDFIDSQVIPVAKIHFKSEIPKNISIVPIIYITQRAIGSSAFKDIDYNKIYAQKISKLLNEIAIKQAFKVQEIQVDCDWNETTKTSYFHLVENLKKASKVPITSTLRLHQIKYFQKTGIPPADKFVLMFYNFGTLSAKGVNSIFNPNDYLTYVNSLKDYPKKMSIALPIFAWYVWSRDSKIMDLIPVSEFDMNEAKKYFTSRNNSCLVVTNRVIYHNYLFQKGDILRLEKPNPEHINKAIKQIKLNEKYPFDGVIIYELNSEYINLYNHDEIKKWSREL